MSAEPLFNFKTFRTARLLKSPKSSKKKEILKALLKTKEGDLVGNAKIDFDGDDMEQLLGLLILLILAAVSFSLPGRGWQLVRIILMT